MECKMNAVNFNDQVTKAYEIALNASVQQIENIVITTPVHEPKEGTQFVKVPILSIKDSTPSKKVYHLAYYAPETVYSLLNVSATGKELRAIRERANRGDENCKAILKNYGEFVLRVLKIISEGYK